MAVAFYEVGVGAPPNAEIPVVPPRRAPGISARPEGHWVLARTETRLPIVAFFFFFIQKLKIVSTFHSYFLK